MDNIGGDGGSVSAVKGRLTYLKQVVMIEILDAAKVKTFNTDRFRVSKTTRLNASMLKVDEDGNPLVIPDGQDYAGNPLGYKWLVDNGYESLIKPVVNASSLSATAKELIENGRELPEEFFKVHSQPDISVTKKG